MAEKDHLRAESERNQIKGQIFKAIKKRPPLQCLYPQSGGCPNKVIDSHSMQKSSILKPLADSNNHVIMLATELTLEERPEPGARRVGINEASTFNGLCSQHDDLLFKPIEVNPFDTTNDEHHFLCAYRCVMMELHRKHVTAGWAKSILDMADDDSKIHPDIKDFLHLRMEGHLQGVRWLARLKEQLDRNHLGRAFGRRVEYYHRILSRAAPFALASCFTPKYDCYGTEIQSFAEAFNEQKEPQWISMTVMPVQGQTIISMATRPNSSDEIKNICRGIQYHDEAKVELELSEIALGNIENIAIRPSFWDALDDARRDEIMRFFRETINGQRSRFPVDSANLFKPGS